MRSTSLNVLVTGLSIAVSAVFCTNCYDGLDGDDLELSPDSLDPRAFVHTAHVWAKPAAIPVCWENPGPGDATARSWVQQSVMNTWSRFGAVDFTGWGPCSANAKGIRILIADGHPHTKGLGKQLNGVKDGMLLNFTFNAWGNICHQYPGVENCIRWIAAHEFGHALGFAHEQNRPDTPAWCKEPPQGSNGDLIIGAWDEDSIMNYCNDKYTNLGELSTTDVAALQAVYGPRYRWASLGGGVSSIAVGRNLDGRLEVFARGTDSALWHTWQTTPNGGWSGWASLGGGILATPAIAANSDGRLEAFVQGTDGALWHNWQTTPNGAWSGWASLGGWLANPAVGRNHDGRLEVFGVGSDSAVYHIWQNTPSGSWSGWSGMGGVASGPIAVGSNSDGRLEVFVRGSDSALHHAWQTTPSGAWSGWASLGGVLTGPPALAKNADGRLEVFVQGTADRPHHIWQNTPGGGWSGWSAFEGAVKSMSVTRNLDGRLELFARGTDQALYHNWQTAPNGAWSGWATLSGSVKSNLSAAQNQDGRLEVFAIGTDNAVWHTWQSSPGGVWN